MNNDLLNKILQKSTKRKTASTLGEMEINQEVVQSVYNWANSMVTGGEVASYIPELSKVDPQKSAISIGDLYGNIISAGNGQDIVISVQSVIKPFLYIYALEQGLLPEDISNIEATARPFNADAILKWETQEKRPGHPLNNAGAISSAGAIKQFEEFLSFMRELTGNPKLDILQNVFESEMKTNSNNQILTHKLVELKRFDTQDEGMLALENYTKACAIGVTTKDAVQACLVLADRGRDMIREDNVVRVINAMNSYGLYEKTGEISLLASGTRALSCKSGVGGLIINIDPGRGAFCTYSPLLDEAGNSVFGKYALIPLNNILGAPDAMRLSAEEVIRSLTHNK
jgi:glutaminase